MKKIKLVMHVPVVIEVDAHHRREILIEEVLPDLRDSCTSVFSPDYRWHIATEKITRKQVLDALLVAENKRAR